MKKIKDIIWVKEERQKLFKGLKFSYLANLPSHRGILSVFHNLHRLLEYILAATEYGEAIFSV